MMPVALAAAALFASASPATMKALRAMNEEMQARHLTDMGDDGGAGNMTSMSH